MSESSGPLNLQQQRKRAKELLKSAHAGDSESIAQLISVHPDASSFKLAHAQLAIARQAGFDSWAKLLEQLEAREMETIARAIQSGDAQTVRRMLAASARLRRRINEPRFPFGGRAIHAAASHRAVLDVLIDFGADINARSDWEKGPFGVLDYCDQDTARHLISRGARLTAHAAARLGWLDELRTIVDGNPAVVHEMGGDGQRPLHFAKTSEVVDFLLERGAEIDARCVDHFSTAAQYALLERPDVCRRLLERGATPDIFMPARLGDVALAERIVAEDPSSLGARTRLANYTPVHPFGIYLWTLGFCVSPHDVALNFGHRDLYEKLLGHSTPKVRMIDAIMRNDRAKAQSLRDSGVELLPEDHSLLAIAAFDGKHDAAMLMLALGFDANSGGFDGGTALHAAAWMGDVVLVEAILQTGRVDPDSRDPTHHSTPLGWAQHGSQARCAPNGDYGAVVERLLAAGASTQ